MATSEDIQATLTPVDGRKSFYGKCTMLGSPKGEVTYLRSYETIVAEYDHDSGVMIVHGWYSMTTARHINSFLKYFGFGTACKAELEAWEPMAL